MASPYVASRDTYTLEKRKARLLAPYGYNPADFMTEIRPEDANKIKAYSMADLKFSLDLFKEQSAPPKPPETELGDSNATYVCYDTYSCVGWTEEKWQKALPRVAAMLKKLVKDSGAHCIVVHGTSGLVMGSRLLGYDCGAPFVMLRKEGEKSHGSMIQWLSARPADGQRYINKYVWLDDMVCSGDTEDRVRSYMRQSRYNGHEATTMVARCLYRGAELARKELFHGGYDAAGLMFKGAFH